MKEMKLGLAFGCAVCAVGTAVAGIEFTAERHLQGFDGRLCKIQPAVESDGGKVALMTYQKLLLTGSDVFYGQFIRRSADGGRTWTEPREIEVLKDTREHGLRVAHVANPRYNRKFGKWFALGVAETFKDDKARSRSSSADVPTLGRSMRRSTLSAATTRPARTSRSRCRTSSRCRSGSGSSSRTATC